MKLYLPTKIRFERIIEFTASLFVFVLMVDPSDNILRLKIPLFVLLFGLCVVAHPRVNRNIIFGAIVYSTLLLTTLISNMAGYNSDPEFTQHMYKTFLMLWLLPWVPHLRLIDKLRIPALFISFVVITIYLIVVTLPQLELPIQTLLNSDKFDGTILLSRRTFVGIDIIAVYYSSAPVLLLYLGYSFSKYLNSERKRISQLLQLIVIFTALLMCGTRTLMLCTVATIVFLVILYFWKRGGIFRMVAVYGTMAAFALSVLVLGVLLRDSGEESLEVKTVLANAFYKHVDQNPETIVWGNGVGATFDSLGIRGSRATQSELLYLEFVRWFGVPLAIVILSVYIYPMLLIFSNYKYHSCGAAMVVGYILYIALSGTNPYLIGSNGLLALLIMFSYAQNNYYKTELEL